MQLSVTTDYAKDTGSPEPYLRRIADAGFSHVHWCHQWNTDFLYSRWEIEQIGKWLKKYHLQMLDLHGSAGVERSWTSSHEYERLAGVELVRNRIDMASALSAGVVIMHTGEPDGLQEDVFRAQVRKSLDVLRPYAKRRGVRIAVENGNWQIIRRLLDEYPPSTSGYAMIPVTATSTRRV